MPNYKYWAMFRKVLDQGQEGTCVGHAWRHWLTAAPVISHKHRDDPSAVQIYDIATNKDVWPGNEGDRQFGTSVRAGAEALIELGHIINYYWAWLIQDVNDYLLLNGAAVAGVNWYSSMFEPDKDGIVKVDGFIAGGHAVLLQGINVKTGFITFVNSWGTDWGKNGRAKIAIEDFERLLNEDGEVCTALEVRK